MTRFDIITLFPEIFENALDQSILGRAIKNKKIKVNLVNLRDFARNKHKTVDDKPFGGGPGMLMKVDVIYKALEKLTINFKKDPKRRIILFDPRGKTLNQKLVQTHASKYNHFILICGRYEGVDERILKFVDEQLSIGDFITTGGELPALIFVDAVTRQIPGVLGKEESLADETFKEKGYKKYPQYTQPREFEGLKVPEILLSGDHKKIKNWREK